MLLPIRASNCARPSAGRSGEWSRRVRRVSFTQLRTRARGRQAFSFAYTCAPERLFSFLRCVKVTAPSVWQHVFHKLNHRL